MRALAFLCLLAAAAGVAAQPQRLSETGLYAPGVVAFTPRYALWTDGQSKRRWLYLPPGTSIDTSRPQAWEFPRGTKAWKEFSLGRKIETRLIERLADGSWRYATYVWNAAGTEALLAPAEGIPAQRIPSRADCLACHEGTTVPILGYSAVQLTGKLAPAAGYLHANCGHCHNDSGPLAGLGLVLAQPAAAPDQPEQLLRRMRSPNPLTRMPPLGVHVPDAEGIALVARWIHRHLPTQPEPKP